MDNQIPSYAKVYAIGHKEIEGIFDDDVVIQEKIDGSQISFALLDGELVIRSKGKHLVLDQPEKMFAKAVEQIQQRVDLLRPEWIYRGEYLEKPKHNTLAYNRVPIGNIILFDVMTGDQYFLSPEELQNVATATGFESVPVMYQGPVADVEAFKGFLEIDSVLGGQKVEGVVAKSYTRFTRDGKAMAGKYVSPLFKEVHQKDWKTRNPTGKAIVDKLIDQYRTPSRWNKAIQHLRERGELQEAPQDIGPLLKEIGLDTQEECEDEIKQKLFKHFWPKIQRGITAGFPEWYKEQLLESAFEEEENV